MKKHKNVHNYWRWGSKGCFLRILPIIQDTICIPKVIYDSLRHSRGEQRVSQWWLVLHIGAKELLTLPIGAKGLIIGAIHVAILRSNNLSPMSNNYFIISGSGRLNLVVE